MSKTAYNIQLKGDVGGYDFDRSDVDAVLAENDGKTIYSGLMSRIPQHM